MLKRHVASETIFRNGQTSSGAARRARPRACSPCSATFKFRRRGAPECGRQVALSRSRFRVRERSLSPDVNRGKSCGGSFEPLRGRLFAVAYRMTGTRADAEDIVQEAYLRWHQADAGAVRSPEAWLVSVATRLSIDRLRKASAEREKYTGPWLPEPLFGDPSPEERLELASDISLAFMVLLERLAPVERAAFLLHDVFDRDYPEIACVLRKSEAACRQVVHRARERVRSERRRFRAGEEEYRGLIEKFTEAARAGDEATLLSLFAEDATLTSDGGGVVPADDFIQRRMSWSRELT
ncbi:MAG: sigma-70 family RNA polymerase sigma factor [Pyrinomonadaceae bacterium]